MAQKSPPVGPTSAAPSLSDPVAENLDIIGELHARALQEAGIHQRAIERLLATIGRPLLLYAALVFTAGWIAANSMAPIVGYLQWDPPPFFWHTKLLTSILTSVCILQIKY